MEADRKGPVLMRLADIPKSLMLKTPGTLELALRFPSFAASFGLDERPWTAESTLLKGSVADMMTS